MKEPRRIAVFRIGHLGDTIVALPALWTIRKRFPSATIFLLTQNVAGSGKVDITDFLPKGAVFDDILLYKVGAIPDLLKTILRFRQAKIDTVAYLPSHRTAKQLTRDRLFFKLAGVKRLVGFDSYINRDYRPKGVPLPMVAHETDNLLKALSSDGVSVPQEPSTLMHMGLTPEERSSAKAWLESQGVAPGTLLIGVGPGSEMTSKLWGVEKYRQVLASVDAEVEATFVAFGSGAESAECEQSLAGVKRGINAAGKLSVRESAAVFEHVAAYVGNDTGTMHIAASSGTKCVAVFAARDWPGRWYPFGPGHTVLRQAVECEGCMLEVCDKNNLCLEKIPISDVTAALKSTVAQTTRRALQ